MGITDLGRQYVASAEFALELRKHIFCLVKGGATGDRLSRLIIAFIAWALSGHDIKTVPTDREVPILHTFVGNHADEIFAATEDIEDGIELVLFSAEEGN